MPYEPPRRPRAVGRLPTVLLLLAAAASAQHDDKTLRVFIFAGQSNMVGSDSKAKDIERFPPFAGLEEPQEREVLLQPRARGQAHVERVDELQPVDDVVGPELSFARTCRAEREGAARDHQGRRGRHAPRRRLESRRADRLQAVSARARLGEAPRSPTSKRAQDRLPPRRLHVASGRERHVRAQVPRGLRGQPEELHRPLAARSRRAELRFYVGQLCTKTIWGMDLRKEMYAIERRAARGDRRRPARGLRADVARRRGDRRRRGPALPLRHARPARARRQLRRRVPAHGRQGAEGLAPAEAVALPERAARSSSSSSPGTATWKANAPSCRI
jgi:hypothetical protein